MPWKDRRKTSKYCKSIFFQVWYYKKFKTTKICAINNGAYQNIVRSQLPKNTTKHYSSSRSINDQWMHTMNMLSSEEIPGDGQRFELQSCRQMLAFGRPCRWIPRVPDLWLQGCQIVTALCSWRKEPQILGLSALQLCTCSKDSWSIRELLLQDKTPNLEIFQMSSETWTFRVVHPKAMNSERTILMIMGNQALLHSFFRSNFAWKWSYLLLVLLVQCPRDTVKFEDLNVPDTI